MTVSVMPNSTTPWATDDGKKGELQLDEIS